MPEKSPTYIDAVLGGQNPQLTCAVVLGGLAGTKQLQQKLLDRFGETHHLFSFEAINVDKNGNSISSQQKQNYFFSEYLSDDTLLEMVYVPSGAFIMGSEDYYNEQPPHLVNVSEFHVSKYPIAQSQYQALMGKNPSFFQGGDLLPVENVSWNDAQKFCQNLSDKTGNKYRLLSESEWEYACRAGTNTSFSYGDVITSQLANFSDGYIYREQSKTAYHRQTTVVGSFPANNFGLHDLHGNVWEWCQDTWHNNYQGSPPTSSIWESGDSSCKVLRGGSWLSDAWFCRSTNRSFLSPESKNYSVGFRVAFSL
jgi:formylglycine-generating enzyme required for sulfatase activity